MESSSADGLTRLIAGRYRLVEPIGHGGMATVFRGQDEVLGRHVAVKLFRASAVDPDDVGRQETEMRVLASLSHPGLVTLFDAGKDDAGRDDGAAGEPRAFLVMELVDGPDLRKRLREGPPMTAFEAAHVGAELAGALAYIHARGVIHRDVKPANILLPATIPGMPPRAQLTDFGIARMIDGARLTATGATLGTANYLSPEQASGSSATTASDVYSLGLVLLECLTGRVEFSGSAVESAVARLSRDPAIPESLAEPWRRLLPRMTDRDPGQRPEAAAVAAELLGFRWGEAGSPESRATPPATSSNTAPRPGPAAEEPGRAAAADGPGLVPLPTMTTAEGMRQGISRAFPPPPTPPSIGRLPGAAGGTAAPGAGRAIGRGSGPSAFRAMLPAGRLSMASAALPVPAGRRTAGRTLLALLAVTVLTMAVILAAGRIGHAADADPAPGSSGWTGSSQDRPPAWP